MVSEQEKQELFKELDSVKATVRDIKTELDSLNKEKEGWMSKRNSFKNDIMKLIGNVKGLKTERNSLTSEVKLSKSEREKVDTKIPELNTLVEELRKQKKDMFEKLGLSKDAFSLKKEIDGLNHKIETEPMSFNAEKKLMKQINGLKKQLKDADVIMKITRKIRQAMEELDMYNKIRSISNSKVQSMAKNSQTKHENMLEESKKIDELKLKEKEAFDKFKEFKTLYKEKSDLLKEHLQKLPGINAKLGIQEKERKDIEDKKQKKTLAEKRKDVEEKLLRREKLTTEDILILQSDS